MVAGRADERVRVVDVARDHGVDGREARAGGERGDLVARRPDRRVRAGVAVPGLRQPLDALEVVGGVEAQQLVAGRAARTRGRAELLAETADLDQAADPANALGRLRVRARLDEAAGGITAAADPGSCHSMRSWKRRPVFGASVARSSARGRPDARAAPHSDYFFLIQAAGIGAILSLRFSGSTYVPMFLASQSLIGMTISFGIAEIGLPCFR